MEAIDRNRERYVGEGPNPVAGGAARFARGEQFATGQEFADRLEDLFRMVPSPDGRPYTAKAISQKAAALGFKLGESYLSQLRSGKAKSPSFRTVEGIAAAFGVDIHFFLTRDARERTREQIHLMRLHSDPNVFAAAFRHADLAPDAAGLVDDLVRVLREQQGLPPEPDLPAQ